MYIDIGDKIEGVNHQTGERAEVKCIERTNDKKNSRIEGFIMDANGNKVLEVTGSWLDQIDVKDLKTTLTQTIWKAAPLAENSHLQFQYG